MIWWWGSGNAGALGNAESLPSLPGPLWPGVVAPDRVLSMVQKEINTKLMLKWIVWNRTVVTINWTVLTFICM